VTIRIDESTIRHFQELAPELEVPYQTLSVPARLRIHATKACDELADAAQGRGVASRRHRGCLRAR
jgi:hypothetical protein